MARDNSATPLGREVERLAQKPIVIVIATKRAGGSIQLNPVWFALEDRHFIVNGNTRRTWPANLQREREATLLLVDPANMGRYAQIRGRLVDVTPDPDLKVINRLAERYTGKKRARVEPGEQRITFRIAPVKVTGQLI